MGSGDARSIVSLFIIYFVCVRSDTVLCHRGVSHIRLIDFDYVTLSSLNRHATATLADVGTPKVSCIARTLRQISRWTKVECCVEVWRKDDGGRLLEGVDWVVGKYHFFTQRSCGLIGIDAKDRRD